MVQWTADKDQLLLKGLFQFEDIKFSKPLLEYLAEVIGEDCTPKAVSHRLTNIKNSGNPIDTASLPGKKTPKKGAAAVPSTPRSGKGTKSAASKKKVADDEGSPTPVAPRTPPSRKRGRPKKSAPIVAEEESEVDQGVADDEDQEYFDADSEAKKIKLEPEENEALISDAEDPADQEF